MSKEPEIVTTFSFNLSSELAKAIISLDALIKPTVVDVVAPPTINAPVTAVVAVFSVTAPFTVKLVNVPKLVMEGCAAVVTVAAVPLALPVKLAVIVPALKLPLASRATIAFTVFAFVAVVAELLTLLAVLIVDKFVSAIEPANIAFVTFAAPIVVALPTDVTSPVKFALVVTFDAVPVKVAVIVPAAKLPLPSLATIVETVFTFVAVVAELLTLPPVLIVASFVSTIAAEALISPFTIVPSTIIALVTTPDAIVVALPTEVTLPVKFAFVVTLPAVNPAAVPVTFVITPEAGVPSAGVVRVGLVKVLFVSVCVPLIVAISISLPKGPAIHLSFVVSHSNEPDTNDAAVASLTTKPALVAPVPLS